ncbi:MAG: hypothetical protein KAY22_25945 [Rhizorhabdus sp.]|nr:hypothetical protein [Rhizorhabdus sp.]
MDRFLNLYSLRAAIVALLAIVSPAVMPPELVQALTSIADAAGAGDIRLTTLAIFGGMYVLLDVLRKSKAPAGAAGAGGS